MKVYVSLVAVFLLLAPVAATAGDPQVVHTVYFTLKEDTAANREQLVKACHEHLSGHDGTVYFAVSTLADDIKGRVNDLDFDVALHVVFENKAALQAYSKNPRHLTFLRENAPSFAKARVFDSYVADAGD
jgi:hypothetical protein